jgi:hypothetical protein
MRRFSFVIGTGVAFGILLGMLFPAHVVKAQTYCDIAYGNTLGARTAYTCTYYGTSCDVDFMVCERDTCDRNCPTGYVYFCTSFSGCGAPLVNECQGKSCT